MAKPLPNALLLCLLAIALNASSNVFAQGAMQYLPFLAAAVLWFGFGTLYFWITAALRGSNPLRWLREHWRAALVMGSMNYLAAITWFAAISSIGAATTGFLQRFQTLILVVLGILALRETFTRWDFIAMLLAFSGAALITFSVERVQWFGILMAIGAAVANAFHDFLGKRFAVRMDPLALGTCRATATFMLLLITVGFSLKLPSADALPWLAIGPLLSAFLGYWLFFSVLRTVPVSTAAILLNAHPFFVVGFAFLLFGTFPTALQLLGGILIVAGVLIPLMRKAF